jgi:hypothetical protein
MESVRSNLTIIDSAANAEPEIIAMTNRIPFQLNIPHSFANVPMRKSNPTL